MLDAALATPHSEGCLQEVEAALLAVKLHKLDLRRRGLCYSNGQCHDDDHVGRRGSTAMHGAAAAAKRCSSMIKWV